MSAPPLYKTTIVIWSDFDPAETEIDALAREAMDGGAYCSRSKTQHVPYPGQDPDWDGTEFFQTPEGGE